MSRGRVRLASSGEGLTASETLKEGDSPCGESWPWLQPPLGNGPGRRGLHLPGFQWRPSEPRLALLVGVLCGQARRPCHGVIWSTEGYWTFA